MTPWVQQFLGCSLAKVRSVQRYQTDLYYVWLTALCSFISTCINFAKANGKFCTEIYYLLKNLRKKYRPAFDPSPGYYFLLITCEEPSSVLKLKVIAITTASTQLFSTLLLSLGFIGALLVLIFNLSSMNKS